MSKQELITCYTIERIQHIITSLLFSAEFSETVRVKPSYKFRLSLKHVATQIQPCFRNIHDAPAGLWSLYNYYEACEPITKRMIDHAVNGPFIGRPRVLSRWRISPIVWFEGRRRLRSATYYSPAFQPSATELFRSPLPDRGKLCRGKSRRRRHWLFCRRPLKTYFFSRSLQQSPAVPAQCSGAHYNRSHLLTQNALVVLPMLMMWPCFALFLLSSSSPIMIRGFAAGFAGPSPSPDFFSFEVLLGGAGPAASLVAGADALSSTPNCVSPLMFAMSQTRIVESFDPVYSLPSTTCTKWSTTFRHLTSLTNCFTEYDQRTLYDALVVTLSTLLSLINFCFITIIIFTLGRYVPEGV